MLTQAPESLFWYWVNERHAIYQRRAAGQPKPWTEDPILRDYKFTNVFRQLDRGTVWLTEHFIQPHTADDPALLAFNIGWYRLFNWTGTGERLGWQKDWRPVAVRRVLTEAATRGEQIITGAHIVWSEAGKSKIDGVVEHCSALWAARKAVYAIARFYRSLKATFEELRRIKGIGDFIAYEIVTDYRHTAILGDAYDINFWANVGPGALRGLQRLWPEIKPRDGLSKMRDLLARSRANTGAHVPDMELRDIEHALCEVDKMLRVKFGEGRPRSKYPGAA